MNRKLTLDLQGSIPELKEKLIEIMKEADRMIRGLKNIVLFCFGIMAVELVLIILLIWRHHG